MGGDESHRIWLCPGEADQPRPAWATPAEASSRLGPFQGVLPQDFSLDSEAQRAARVLTALSRRQVQPPGYSGVGLGGKPLVLRPDLRTPFPSPQVRDGGQSGGTDQVPVHLQVLSRHPACSLPTPPPHPLPEVSTELRPRSPQRSGLTRRGGVPGPCTKAWGRRGFAPAAATRQCLRLCPPPLRSPRCSWARAP